MASPVREMELLAERDRGWWCSYCCAPLAHPTLGEAGWEPYLLLEEPIWELAYDHRYPQRDHVVPRSAGGPDDLNNLVLACRECNHEKRARPLLIFFALRAGCQRFKRVA